jgi:sugar transferase (PEP-CTERM/EpsH1 system associated)
MDYGGLENGLVNLINWLPRQNYRHVVIALTTCSDFRHRVIGEDVQFMSLGKRPGKNPAAYFRLWRLLRKLRPAVVHTRNTGTVDCAIVAFLAGVRVRIHGHHGWDIGDLDGTNPRQSILRRVSDPFITAYVSVSKDITRWFTSVRHVAASRVFEIYNGVDISKFGRPGRSRDHGERDEFVVGTVGRLEAVKDQKTLIRAFAELLRRQVAGAPKARLVLVGDGSLRNVLQSVATDEGIAEWTVMAGWSDDICGVMQQFDVFVLPSLKEGISNTILEAMACGLPVIATAVGGNPELVIHGETGTLVPVQSPGRVADAIGAYLNAPALARQHGIAGKKRVEEHFSLTKMVEAYDKMYSTFLPAD